MITREVDATAGNVQVYGIDIHGGWDKARKLIGLCPQQSVLFPLLTVRETLLFYSILKNSNADLAETDVSRWVRQQQFEWW